MLTPHSACIAHNTNILTEHNSSANSETANLAATVLPTLNHSEPNKLTYIHGLNYIHIIIAHPSEFKDPREASAGSLVYMCIASAGLGRRIPFGFLVTLREAFLEAFPPATTDYESLDPYGCASFNSTLKRLMVSQGATHEGQQDALRVAQEQIKDVREIMTENIERVLERQERIGILVDKTDRLGTNARDFRVRSRGLRRRMWWKNVKLMVLLALVAVFLVYLFVGFGCGLPGWSRCIGY